MLPLVNGSGELRRRLSLRSRQLAKADCMGVACHMTGFAVHHAESGRGSGAPGFSGRKRCASSIYRR